MISKIYNYTQMINKFHSIKHNVPQQRLNKLQELEDNYRFLLIDQIYSHNSIVNKYKNIYYDEIININNQYSDYSKE